MSDTFVALITTSVLAPSAPDVGNRLLVTDLVCCFI